MKLIQTILSAILVLSGIFCTKEAPPNPAVRPPQTLRMELVDEKTGLPVKNAVCELFGAAGDVFEKLETVFADTTGIVEPDLKTTYDHIVYYISAPGYISKNSKELQLEPGKLNNFKIQFRAFDAMVRLEVENKQPFPDTLFFNLLNGGAIGDAGQMPFLPFTSPLFLQPAEKFTADIPALGDDAVSIFWTWHILELNPYPPFKNVVIIPVGDTLVYKVTN